MNQSGATAELTENGWEGRYRPVWASSFRPVHYKGKIAYFTSKLAAEVAAWRTLYAVEQRVMRRDGATVIAAKAEADRVFSKLNAANDADLDVETITGPTTAKALAKTQAEKLFERVGEA